MEVNPTNDPRRNRSSQEAFYWNADGAKADDWIHEEILANPEADDHCQQNAIRRAVERGMTLECAHQLYG